MNDLIYFRDKLREHKNYCVSRQFFEDATYWRDAERHLDMVINNEQTLNNFFEYELLAYKIGAFGVQLG